MDVDTGINVAKWYTTQAGVLAASFGAIILLLLYLIHKIVKYFLAQIDAAWARITIINDARVATDIKTQEALATNSMAIAKLSTIVDMSDRRQSPRMGL